ncbi:hypothetical protein FH969_13380, partial [Miniimonas arenae]
MDALLDVLEAFAGRCPVGVGHGHGVGGDPAQLVGIERGGMRGEDLFELGDVPLLQHGGDAFEGAQDLGG